jgi:hypothetical protein
MIASRRQDSVRKHAATSDAINEFLLGGTLISIRSVAVKAGVSRNFIYSHPELLHHLEAARKTQADSKTIPGQRQPTNGAPGHHALVTELALANQTIKRLRHHVAELQAKHQHCLGAQLNQIERQAQPECPHTRCQETKALYEENQAMRARNDELLNRITDLTEDLIAERRASMY